MLKCIVDCYMYKYAMTYDGENNYTNHTNRVFSFSVLNLAMRFPQIINHDERDTLQEEFLEYQLTPQDELPSTESGIDTF